MMLRKSSNYADIPRAKHAFFGFSSRRVTPASPLLNVKLKNKYNRFLGNALRAYWFQKYRLAGVPVRISGKISGRPRIGWVLFQSSGAPLHTANGWLLQSFALLEAVVLPDFVCFLVLLNGRPHVFASQGSRLISLLEDIVLVLRLLAGIGTFNLSNVFFISDNLGKRSLRAGFSRVRYT